MAGAALLAIVGVVLLAGSAMGLVFVLEEDITEETSPTGLFNVQYSTTNKELPQKGAAMTSSTTTFTVSDGNVTKATVKVTCTDVNPNAPAFTYRVEVRGPNQLRGEKTGVACNGQPVEIPIEVTPVPTDGTVIGDDESEARANLKPDGNESKAKGEWQVVISGSRAVGLPVGAPTGQVSMSISIWKPDLVAVGK